MGKYIDLIKELKRDQYIFLTAILIFFSLDIYCIIFLHHNLFYLINSDFFGLNIKLLPIIAPFLLLCGIAYYHILPMTQNITSVFLDRLSYLLLIIFLRFFKLIQKHFIESKTRTSHNSKKLLKLSSAICKGNNIINRIEGHLTTYRVYGTFFASEKFVKMLSVQKVVVQKSEVAELINSNCRLYLALTLTLFITFFQNNSLFDFFDLLSPLAIKTIYLIYFLIALFKYLFFSMWGGGALKILDFLDNQKPK